MATNRRCLHASCGARDGSGVLLMGPPGAGKSDLLLRLIDRGFLLVADDQVEVENGVARPPAGLAGLLEVRGLGILRFPYLAAAPIALVAVLETGERLPKPIRCPDLDLPLIHIMPGPASAPQRIALALDCLQGRVGQLAGAFA